MSKIKSVIAIILMCSSIAWADAIVYSQLKMKDYDEMMNGVKTRIQSAEKTAETDVEQARIELQLALLFILSRPDNDNMVSKLIPLVRSPLKNLEAYEEVLTDIADRAINTAKDKNAKPSVGATSLIVLENMMGELKPEIKSNQKIKDIFVKIRDAKITPSKAIQHEMKMRAMMKVGLSPSETAQKVIGKAP